ncbi:MAG: hypothetical protein HC850_14715, partial [Rhodomicrobium sp.]|nr:hypothetical protein [Rhodomicrobium sp.]
MNLLTALGIGVNKIPQTDSLTSSTPDAPREDARFTDDYRRETSKSDGVRRRPRSEEAAPAERPQRLAPEFEATGDVNVGPILPPTIADETEGARRVIELPTEGLALLDGRLFLGPDTPRRSALFEGDVPGAILPA